MKTRIYAAPAVKGLMFYASARRCCKPKQWSLKRSVYNTHRMESSSFQHSFPEKWYMKYKQRKEWLQSSMACLQHRTAVVCPVYNPDAQLTL